MSLLVSAQFRVRPTPTGHTPGAEAERNNEFMSFRVRYTIRNHPVTLFTSEQPNVFQNIPGLKDKKEDSIPFEDIIYHVVRCQLLHNAELPDEIEFIDKTRIQNDNGTLKISKTFIIALIVLVVSSKKNKNEQSPARFSIRQRDKILKLDQLWGDKEKIRDIVGL